MIVFMGVPAEVEQVVADDCLAQASWWP